MVKDPFVKDILKQFKEGLTLDGRNKVFQNSCALTGADLKDHQNPEEYTKYRLIEPILQHLECKIDNKERHFEALSKHSRNVDYTITTKDGTRYIIEAKAFNADLFEKNVGGAVNQILDALKLVDVVKEFQFGIATDGQRWVFYNNERKQIANLTIESDFETITNILNKGQTISFDREAVSKKFYQWYSALLFGGKYRDNKNKSCTIAKEDSLVSSIMRVESEQSREKIAQTTIDRLIFIKFLESKGIIKNQIIHYLYTLEDERLNVQLRSLFFDVMSTKVEQREGVNPQFKDIPYLNGSLFIRIPAEVENPDYRIRPTTLKEVFRFLDSFSFTNEGGASSISLDPEIMGYIFEMSMLDEDRKGTGAFYTPKEITTYMSRDAIHDKFLQNVRGYLKNKEGYTPKEADEIRTMEDVYRLKEMRLSGIFSEVLTSFTVCDNACGSGAFLLAAADVLYDMYMKINENSGLRNSKIGIRRLIISNNLYGVDLNPNAVEIAKLRLWLWLVDVYESDQIPEALPNIDYNILSGNSLVGFGRIDPGIQKSVTLDDYLGGKSLTMLLKERNKLVASYKNKSGDDARRLKKQIDSLSDPIHFKLDQMLFKECAKGMGCTFEQFRELRPFHWGFDFSSVFDKTGFDVIIGNPPYVQLQKMTKSDNDLVVLARRYYEVAGYRSFDTMGDLYCLFYERSNKLLKPAGILSYITSNKWMRNSYGANLRNYFIQNTDMRHVIDIADLQVFKSATVECDILSFQSRIVGSDRNEILVPSCVLSDNSQLEDIEGFVESNMVNYSFELDKPWVIDVGLYPSIEAKMKEKGKLLGEWENPIFFGIKTGLNDAFIIDQKEYNHIIQSDSNSSKLLYPILRGKDIQRYRYSFGNKWIIGTFPFLKLSIEDYPGIVEHFAKYPRELLEQTGEKHIIDGVEKKSRKKTNNRWFETQDTVKYCDEFRKEKIIWGEISDHPKFSLDRFGEFAAEATTFFMTGDHLPYLLGILNSKFSDYAFSHIGTTTGMGTTRWKKYTIQQLPVPVPDEDFEAKFSEKVLALVKAHEEGSDTVMLESEVNSMVYELYGLNDAEIAEVEKFCG